MRCLWSWQGCVEWNALDVLQNCDPDMWGSAVSLTGPDWAIGPEGASHVAADAPTSP